MLGIILGILLGVLLTIVSLASAILYTMNLVSRNSTTAAPGPQSPYVLTPSKEELDAKLNFKPLKEGGASAVRKTWAKIEYRDPKNEESRVTYLQLKANMLFQFPNEESEICIGVCCLDNCHVDTEYKKTKKDVPIWKPNNGLILSCPTRDLLPGHQTIVIYFKTGKELEEWYYACLRSSSLTKLQSIEQKRQQEHWTHLSAKLTNTAVQNNPDWLIAIASRFFYNVYDSQNFLNLILKEIRKKINQVPKPSYVSDISVPSIYFGANLPSIKSVRLISISNEGAVELEGEFSYDGGFKIRIEVTFKISFPGSRVVYIPVVLFTTIQKISGKVHLHCDAPPASCFWLGFYEEPEIELKIDTEIGENYKIRQIPRLATIIVNKIKQQIVENMVLPNMGDFPLPKVNNPLKHARPPLKKIESEPILKSNNKIIYLEDEVPNQPNQDLLDSIDKQLLEFVESESTKKETLTT